MSLLVEEIDLSTISATLRSEWSASIQQQMDRQQMIRDRITISKQQEEKEQEKHHEAPKSPDLLAPPPVRISQRQRRRAASHDGASNSGSGSGSGSGSRSLSPSPSRSASPSPSRSPSSPSPSRSPSPNPSLYEDPRRDAPPANRWWGSFTGTGAIDLMSAYQRATYDNGECIVLRIYDSNQTTRTVALGMITVIPQYDWAAYIPGKIGKIIRKILGTQYPIIEPQQQQQQHSSNNNPIRRMLNKFQHVWQSRRFLLTRRFGMVCTQWPFRSAMFPLISSCDLISCDCSNLNLNTTNDDEIHTSLQHQLDCICYGEGVILDTIIEYNSQSSSLQCDTLFHLSRATTTASDMLRTHLFLPVSIPSTYVVDLRPYHGLDLSGYTKLLKRHGKRIRLGPFEKAHGRMEVIPSQHITRQQLQHHLQMQQQVAAQHIKDEQPPMILQPSMALLEALVQKHDTQQQEQSECDRSLCQIQLGEDHQVMAESILFRFGKSLLTTDLSGMDQHKLNDFLARHDQHVAIYSVKLLLILEYALKQRIDFVEYGATTGDWKLEAGATAVPLIAGLHFNNRWIRKLTTCSFWRKKS